MKKFDYKITTNIGHAIGTIEADSNEEAQDLLEEQYHVGSRIKSTTGDIDHLEEVDLTIELVSLDIESVGE